LAIGYDSDADFEKFERSDLLSIVGCVAEFVDDGLAEEALEHAANSLHPAHGAQVRGLYLFSCKLVSFVSLL